MDYLVRALQVLEPTSLSRSARLETIGLLNGLVTLFARTELRRRHSSGDTAHTNTSYLTTATTADRHPLLTGLL